MSAAEPIVLGSSSPAPPRAVISPPRIAGSEAWENSKENLTHLPLAKTRPNGPPTHPQVFQDSRIEGLVSKPSTSAVFKTPLKYSPARRADQAENAADVEGQGEPATKKARTDDTAVCPQKQVAAKMPKQTKSTRTVTRVVLDKYGALQDNPAAENLKDAVVTVVADTSKVKQTKKRNAKARKPAAKPVQPKLLDPETANRNIDRQEVFFGTSSQLTRPETVGEVRDLQAALSASEQIDAIRVQTGLGYVPAGKSRQTGTRSLWAVGARGDEDFLLERDVQETRGATLAFRAADFVDIDAIEKTDGPTEKLRASSDSHVRKSTLVCGSPEQAAREAGADTDVAAGEASGKGLEKTPSGRQAQAQATPPPKRPRGRPRKNKAADTETLDATKRKRAPTKTKKATADATCTGAETVRSDDDGFANIDEIEDGEQERRATPTRRGSRAAALELSPTGGKRAPGSVVKTPKKKRRTKKAPPRDAEEIRDWQAEAAVLFDLVSRTVQRAAGGSELGKPSWHEKMLLYDPICVEDLTEWLNAGPLEAACEEQDANSETRWEGQVETWKIKIWCEHNSVCCYNRDVVKQKQKAKD